MTPPIAIVSGRPLFGTPAAFSFCYRVCCDLARDYNEAEPLGPAVAFYVAWNADPVIVRQSKTVFVFGAKAKTWVQYTVRPTGRVHQNPDLGWIISRAKIRRYAPEYNKLLETIETELKGIYGNE